MLECTAKLYDLQRPITWTSPEWIRRFISQHLVYFLLQARRLPSIHKQEARRGLQVRQHKYLKIILTGVRIVTGFPKFCWNDNSTASQFAPFLQNVASSCGLWRCRLKNKLPRHRVLIQIHTWRGLRNFTRRENPQIQLSSVSLPVEAIFAWFTACGSFCHSFADLLFPVA